MDFENPAFIQAVKYVVEHEPESISVILDSAPRYLWNIILIFACLNKLFLLNFNAQLQLGIWNRW